MKWNESKISKCIDILRDNTNLSAAIEEINEYFDEEITLAALRAALKRNDKKSPSKYLENSFSWNSKKISKCIEILSKHEDYNKARLKICNEFNAEISTNALQSAFYRYGKDAPSSFLGGKKSDEDLNVDDEEESFQSRAKKEFYNNLGIDIDDVDGPVGMTEKEDKKKFDEEKQEWIVYLSDGVKRVDVEVHREVKKLYSDYYGKKDYETINAITNITGWSRDDFFEYKNIFGWTHDSGPHTSKEKKEAAFDDEKKKGLKRDLAKAVDRELEDFTNKYEYRELKKRSKRLAKLEKNELNPFKDFLSNNLPPKKVSKLDLKDNNKIFDRDYGVFAGAVDTHIGLLAARDQTPVEQALIKSTKQIVQRIDQRGQGNPDVVWFPVASDWIHFDSNLLETVNGTSMAGNIDGKFEQMKFKACELVLDVANIWRQISDVKFIPMKGNHDESTIEYILFGLEQAFKRCDDVEVELNFNHRHYEQYGRNMLMFCHGAYVSDNDMPTVMANEKPSVWGNTDWRYALRGHKHSITEKENGVHVIGAPALSESSRWVRKQGKDVLSNRAQAAYLFDKKEGHFSREIKNIKD